jgi:murein DD-endopeptidase MepM/ murein hydrolase activator NlpD
MVKQILQLIIISTFLIAETDERDSIQVGGKIPFKPSHQRNCLTDYERQYIMDNSIDLEFTSRDTVMFHQPVGNGGMMNGDKNYITNYVDENPSNGWIEDYNCYFVTYDGHWGTDIAVSGFYYMDEMTTPILAAARGVVIYTHDGEFDRWTYWSNTAVSNTVGLQHTDGTRTYYLHMKKNSVSVSLGDTVQVGDTLGFIGSSGFSDGPHLHFEVNTANWSLVDPWEGECGMGESRWVNQLPFIGDSSAYPQRVFRYLNTAYPAQNDDEYSYIVSENIPSLTHINPGDNYMSLVAVRNLYAEDTLTWRWFKDGTFVNYFSFIPGQTQWWYQGAPYYATSYWWVVYDSWLSGNENVGEWEERVFINSTLVGQKSFRCNTQPNQAPIVDFQQIEVELGQTVTGEFTATDDGDPFWFNLETESTHGGEIELYGGRRRKFEYTAPTDFTGYDIVGISATDDRGETGAMTLIIFEVYGPGLINMAVEPSYIPLEQDSAFISATVIGGNDEISVQAFINNENSGDAIIVDLVNNNGDWSVYWSPETESFFNVDLQLINGAENDTAIYENVGYFTSVGPVSVNMVGDLIAYPGDVIVLDFIVENNSPAQVAPDISILFEAESMNCITNISSNSIFLGDILAGDSVSSTPPNFFVAQLNNVCNSDSTIFVNVNIRSGEHVYWYDDFILNIEMLSAADGEAVPKEYALGAAYPNPFNPIARIDYNLIQKNYVTLEIHNLIGRKIKTLVSLEKDAGFHSTYWDATNNAGDPVSAGVYLYTIQAGEFRQTKKMVLLK